ncbi:hypothetical protein, partial [Staphylococcus aureus]
AGAPDALSAASVAKLLRNLSIVVLIPAAAWRVRKSEQETPEAPDSDPRLQGAPLRAPKTSAVPFFVFAFILFVIVRTVGDSVFG